jgi:hypothetical protein
MEGSHDDWWACADEETAGSRTTAAVQRMTAAVAARRRFLRVRMSMWASPSDGNLAWGVNAAPEAWFRGQGGLP